MMSAVAIVSRPVHITPEEFLKTEVSLLKRIKCFPPVHTTCSNNHRSFWICMRKSRQGNPMIDYIVVEKHLFQNVSRPHENAKPAFSNSSGLRSVFERLRIRDGLVWTVGLTVEKSYVFKFLRRGVDAGSVWKLGRETNHI